MRVLCVAEKPSIAKSISGILSGGHPTVRQSGHTYIKNYDFDYPQANAFFTVTAVLGHLTEHDFSPQYSKWTSCDPFQLFEAPVISTVKKDNEKVAQNLKNEARRAQVLMIWTDCDREGEKIGAEIANVCKEANARIVVRRARFSAIIPQQIHRAAQNPVQLDMAQVNAVDARSILDLRIGSAFTRLQTLNLQPRFQRLTEVISYGPCQFPTLGFVVSRYHQIKAFRPETFHYIFLSLKTRSLDGEDETVFLWRRGHIFSLEAAVRWCEPVIASQHARVTKVTTKETKKWKPLPLTTVDLQKAGSRLLRMSPKRILDIAESLYQKGLVSYPRTETDRFDPQFDLMSLIDKQAADPAWGPFATGLQNGGFSRPRQGKHDDKAHPPIHPTSYSGVLANEEKRVYEYITRRFLAACSKDALGFETTVEVECGGEEFHASGLNVTERNYLDVFPYDKWSDKELPQFHEGYTFVPSVCELREGQTSKPALLTEADLVTMMDKNGIGTDATIAQHIQTIVDREYVIEKMHGNTKYLVPSKLGIGLVEGYDAIGFDRSLSKPYLRRETERRLIEICEGLKSRNEMLEESIEQYKEMFMRTKLDFNKLVTCVGDRLEGNGQADGNEDVDMAIDDDEGGGDGGRGGRGGRGGGGRGRGARGARGGRGHRGGRGGRGGGAGAAAQPDNSDDSDDDGGGPSRGARGTRARGTARGVSATRRGRGTGRAAPPAPPPPQPAHPAQSLSDDEYDAYFNNDPILLVPLPPPIQPPRVRPPSPPPRPAPNEDELPPCHCGVPCRELTVTRDTVNKGRRFRSCGNDRTCNFFEWVDDSPGTTSTDNFAGPSSSRQLVPAKRSMSDRSAARKRCWCGLTAVQRETTYGKSLGRKFWSCPNESDKAKCKFFDWVDDDAGPSSQGGASGGGGGGPSGSCFECGMDGHWAKDCSNKGRNQFEASKRTKSAGYATSTSSATCFKCNQVGHYSNACPNGNSRASGSSSSRGSKRGRGGSRKASSTKGRRGKKSSSYNGAADDF